MHVSTRRNLGFFSRAKANPPVTGLALAIDLNAAARTETVSGHHAMGIFGEAAAGTKCKSGRASTACERRRTIERSLRSRLPLNEQTCDLVRVCDYGRDPLGQESVASPPRGGRDRAGHGADRSTERMGSCGDVQRARPGTSLDNYYCAREDREDPVALHETPAGRRRAWWELANERAPAAGDLFEEVGVACRVGPVQSAGEYRHRAAWL